MSAASNYLENKLLDHTLRYGTAPYTGVTTLYLALFNNTSGSAATNLEAGTLTDETSTSGTAYARKAVTFAAASSGTSATNATVATANWGTITHVAVMDGGTAGAGNVLFWGAVTTPKTIETGDTFQVSSGNLTISLA
jgi:hypothetical protein